MPIQCICFNNFFSWWKRRLIRFSGRIDVNATFVNCTKDSHGKWRSNTTDSENLQKKRPWLPNTNSIKHIRCCNYVTLENCKRAIYSKIIEYVNRVLKISNNFRPVCIATADLERLIGVLKTRKMIIETVQEVLPRAISHPYLSAWNDQLFYLI